MHIAASRSASTCSTDTRLDQAMAAAELFSTRVSLPQTVYRNTESGGWWHTNPYSPRLHTAEVHISILPANYFR
ncbi:MAG: hypothetical protein Q7T63_08555 [Burkholderiaceae bacterium]|nr:hypothetical protein [Burkholderiaceae bacterium]MDP3136740.1 hypothetical protein [Burkholderiaceae bacterium]